MTDADRKLVADYIQECLDTQCPLLGRHPETADEFRRSLHHHLGVLRYSHAKKRVDRDPMPDVNRKELRESRQHARDLKRILADPELPAFLLTLEDELIFGPRFSPTVNVQRLLPKPPRKGGTP